MLEGSPPAAQVSCCRAPNIASAFLSISKDRTGTRLPTNYCRRILLQLPAMGSPFLPAGAMTKAAVLRSRPPCPSASGVLHPSIF